MKSDTKEITIRGNRICHEDLHALQEEVILLVHGHPFNHSMWKYQYEALADFRLLLSDLKGYGQSEYTFDKIYIEGQALDLALLSCDNYNCPYLAHIYR